MSTSRYPFQACSPALAISLQGLALRRLCIWSKGLANLLPLGSTKVATLFLLSISARSTPYSTWMFIAQHLSLMNWSTSLFSGQKVWLAFIIVTLELAQVSLPHLVYKSHSALLLNQLYSSISPNTGNFGTTKYALPPLKLCIQRNCLIEALLCGCAAGTNRELSFPSQPSSNPVTDVSQSWPQAIISFSYWTVLPLLRVIEFFSGYIFSTPTPSLVGTIRLMASLAEAKQSILVISPRSQRKRLVVTSLIELSKARKIECLPASTWSMWRVTTEPKFPPIATTSYLARSLGKALRLLPPMPA